MIYQTKFKFTGTLHRTQAVSKRAIPFGVKTQCGLARGEGVDKNHSSYQSPLLVACSLTPVKSVRKLTNEDPLVDEAVRKIWKLANAHSLQLLELHCIIPVQHWSSNWEQIRSAALTVQFVGTEEKSQSLYLVLPGIPDASPCLGASASVPCERTTVDGTAST